LPRDIDPPATGAANTEVARYYDASTARFLAVGGSGASLAIHRQLWAGHVRTPEEAAGHINAVMQAEAQRLLGQAPGRVRDLGCGVGGSVLTLARDWPQTAFLGITISGAQQARAEAEAAARGLSERCRFRRADFADWLAEPPAELAIAVESHVHAPSAAAFLEAAARHVAPSGVLLIVDDMLARPESALAPDERRRLASFRKGWRLGHVPDEAGLVAAAEAAGFEHVGTQDFTALIRLNRLRDIVLRAAGPLAERLRLNRIPFFANVIGGNALTESYRHGTMRYVMVSLRRRPG
jgi:cyclopropane fatty-acyl-phospholipid synthase-like methyltransferase